MATRRRSVKHTRRRHRNSHHAKTNKRLSKRYRGRKGYNKRITRRHTRRSDNTDIINTQGGGALASYSEAKTAAGKVYEQLIVMRYLLKRAYESQSNADLSPLRGFEILREYANLKSNEEHDLPESLAKLYNKYVSEINPDGTGGEDSAVVTSDEALVSNKDETFFEKMDDLFSGKLPGANFSIKAKKIDKTEALNVIQGRLNVLYGKSIDSADAHRIFKELFIGTTPYYLIVIYYVECPFVLPSIGLATPKIGRLLFSVQLQQINIKEKIAVIKGSLTYGEIQQILSYILEINRNIKTPNAKDICDPIKDRINELLERKGSLLRVHPRYHAKYTSNRLQCSTTISRALLEEAIIVNEPSSPTALASRTPLAKAGKSDEKTHQVRRRIHSTPELHGLTFSSVVEKTPEDLGKIILCRFKNNPTALQRIYTELDYNGITSLIASVCSQELEPQTPTTGQPASFANLLKTQNQVASSINKSRKPPASASIKPPASASIKPPASASGKPPASASGKPPASATSRSKQRSTGVSRIGNSTQPPINYYRDFKPSQSRSRMNQYALPIPSSSAAPMG